MSDKNKTLHSITLKRDKFSQNDCKRLFKAVKNAPEFSHRENRVFYFYCTKEVWSATVEAINLMNQKLGKDYKIEKSCLKQ